MQQALQCKQIKTITKIKLELQKLHKEFVRSLNINSTQVDSFLTESTLQQTAQHATVQCPQTSNY